ncbi:hypothetical protein J3459_018509 [Metarhizium acridum]|nr:hypothetical protein J3459_018509 [Metarhizium acridum]
MLGILVSDGDELIVVIDELVFLTLEVLVLVPSALDTLVLGTIVLDILMLCVLVLDIFVLNTFVLDGCELLIAVVKLAFIELGILVLGALLLDASVFDTRELLDERNPLVFLELDALSLNVLVLDGSELPPAVEKLVILELVDYKLLVGGSFGVLAAVGELVDVLSFPELDASVLVAVDELVARDGCELLVAIDTLDALVLDVFLPDNFLDSSRLLIAVDRLEALLLDNVVLDGFGLLVTVDKLVLVELNNCELLAAVNAVATLALDVILLDILVIMIVDKLGALVLNSCEVLAADAELVFLEPDALVIAGVETVELGYRDLCGNDELEDILLDDRGLFVGMDKLLSDVDRRGLLELTEIDEPGFCTLGEDAEERGFCELVSDIEEPESTMLDGCQLSTDTDKLLVDMFESSFLELIAMDELAGIDELASVDELDSFLLEIDTQELGVCELEGIILDGRELLEDVDDLIAGADELASLGLIETNVLGFCEREGDAERRIVAELFDGVDEPELESIVLDNLVVLLALYELALRELGFCELARGAEIFDDCELFDATDELEGIIRLDRCELIAGTNELALLEPAAIDELSDIDEPGFCELEGGSEKVEDIALNDCEPLLGGDELVIRELTGIEELGFCELAGVFDEPKKCALDDEEPLKGIEELFILELGSCELHEAVELCC